MKTTPLLLLATAASALLSACGGDSAPPKAVDPVPLSITSTNQSAVARATVAAGFSVARTGTVSVADGRARVQSAGRAGLSAGTGALDAAVRAALGSLQFQAARSGIAALGAHVASVLSAPAEACDGGGTRTATFDDRDNNTVTSAGDVVTVVFARCNSDHVVLDGTMVMTVASVTGTTQLSGTMQFQRLTVTTGSLVTTVAGTATVTETDTGTETDIGIVSGATPLSVAMVSPSYTDTITLGSGFTIATASQDAADGDTISLSGNFNAASLPSLDGVLTVSTLQPVVTTSASAYPTSGKLRVTASGGGVLLLTVANATQVELQLDADGNGSYEGDSFVAWTTLIPQ